ncbi:peptidoglycan-binding domain-containing protein [Methylobrevis pamukkalensis]|nr:peptidoglycan-binding domain-containing protein [Methylobrevis pamukkalensis]
MLAMAGAIITNAVAMQPGRHPSPLFDLPVAGTGLTDTGGDPAVTDSIRPARPLTVEDLRQREVVSAVQEELRARGYYDGPVDGLSGPMTAEAVLKYERIHGISPSGEPTDAFLARLRDGPPAGTIPLPPSKPAVPTRQAASAADLVPTGASSAAHDAASILAGSTPISGPPAAPQERDPVAGIIAEAVLPPRAPAVPTAAAKRELDPEPAQVASLAAPPPPPVAVVRTQTPRPVVADARRRAGRRRGA